MKSSNSKGFTLVELMVVVAITGILASVAYPAITEYVKIMKRSDAIEALVREAALMEEFYLNNDTYATAAVSSATSREGFYNITFDGTPDLFTYELVATRTPAGDDPDCLTLTLNQLGTRGSTPGGGNCWN